MKFCQLFGVILIAVQIWHGNASELLPSKNSDGSTTSSADDYGFIEVMIQKLNMKNFAPVNIAQIGQTLQYCQQKMETITDLLVKQYPTSTAENFLELLSTIRDVFEAIGMTANTLESSLNGIVGCVDLAVLDVQIALQVLVEAYISNCDGLVDEKRDTRSDEATTAAVYCLSSATKTLLTSMSEMVEKILKSNEVVDANAVAGIQMIVQTILSIVDRVLYGLKRMNVMDLDDVEPTLDKFALIIQRLASERMNFLTKLSPMIMSPITDMLDSLKSTVNRKLPVMVKKNTESLLMALASVEDTVHEKNFFASVTALFDKMQPMLEKLSSEIHSIKGITDAVAYSTDVSLQNLIATIKCVTYYVAVVSKIQPIETIEIESSLQSMLCFIASTIQTLIDGITVAARRALIDLICLSPTTDTMLLGQQLSELEMSLEPIFLTLENVIRTSIEVVQNILGLGACAINASDLTKNMNVLINNLQRIVKGIMATALTTRDDNQLDVDKVTSSKPNNSLSICVTTFEAVAQNSLDLRVFVSSSIDLIRRYLVQI